MKVAELIKILETYNENFEICIPDGEIGYTTIEGDSFDRVVKSKGTSSYRKYDDKYDDEEDVEYVVYLKDKK